VKRGIWAEVRSTVARYALLYDRSPKAEASPPKADAELPAFFTPSYYHTLCQQALALSELPSNNLDGFLLHRVPTETTLAGLNSRSSCGTAFCPHHGSCNSPPNMSRNTLSSIAFGSSRKLNDHLAST